MKYIHVNLKRFDIKKSFGGVNDYQLENGADWATTIFSELNKTINQFSSNDYQFVFYLPEAYLLSAMNTLNVQSPIKIGAQSVIGHDVTEGKGIGAYTTMRPASAMAGIGINDVIIAHSEERAAKMEFLSKVSYDLDKNNAVIQEELEDEISMAQKSNMNVLYCVGESAEERDNNTWKDVIKRQLTFDKEKVDVSKLKIAYEPIWAIGPNRPVPNGENIQEVCSYIHELIGQDIPVLYGGGLKEANAKEIAGLPDVDGGLIALTSFTDHIGFYPDQFIDIVKKYTNGEA